MIKSSNISRVLKVGPLAYFLISILFILPLVFLFKENLSSGLDSDSWNFIFDSLLLTLILNSLKLVFVTSFFCLLFAIPISLILEFVEIRFKKIFDIVFIIPLALPLYVLAFVYLGLLEWSGPILSFFREQGFEQLGNLKLKNVFGVGFVLSLGLFPYILMPLRLTLRRIDKRLIYSAKSLGKSNFQIFKTIILPFSSRAILLGITVISLEVLADFGAVSIFNYDTFTTSIYMAWSSLYSLPIAARLSLLLLCLSGLFILFENYLKRNGIVASNAKHDRYRPTKFQSLIIYLFLFLVAFVSMILPISQLFVWCFEVYINADGDLFDQYFELLKNTVIIAFITALIITLLSTLINFIERNESKLFSVLRPILLIGYGLPGNIVAVSLLLVMGYFFSEMTTALTMSFLIIGLVYRFLSVGHRSIASVAKMFNIKTEYMAYSLGDTKFKYFKNVWLPGLKDSLILAFLFSFVEAAKEMPLTLMLRPVGKDTLATKIFELTSEGEWELASLGSLLLVFISICVVVITQLKFSRGRNA